MIKKSELQFLPTYWDSISDDAKDLIRKMLDRNQETRIKAQDILNHRWITGEQTKEEEEKVESKEKEIKNFKSSATLSNASSKKQTNSNNKKPTKVAFLPFKIHTPPQEFYFFTTIL